MRLILYAHIPEGKPLWGGPCHKIEIEEVDLCPVNDLKDPEESEKEIGKAQIGGAYIFSDHSHLQTGNVGGGSFIVGSGGMEYEEKVGIGDVAIVWDGEEKILVFADSKAVIAAIKKAGSTGKARSRHLQMTVNMMAEVKGEGGEVKMGWVKAYMGILGNEAADVLVNKLRRECQRMTMRNGSLGGASGSGPSSGRGGICRGMEARMPVLIEQ